MHRFEPEKRAIKQTRLLLSYFDGTTGARGRICPKKQELRVITRYQSATCKLQVVLALSRKLGRKLQAEAIGIGAFQLIGIAMGLIVIVLRPVNCYHMECP